MESSEIKKIIIKCLQDALSSESGISQEIQDEHLLIGNDEYDSFTLVTVFVCIEEKIEEVTGISFEIITEILTFDSQIKSIKEVSDNISDLIKNK